MKNDDRPAGKSRLVLTFEIPSGFTDDAVVDLIAEVAKHCDHAHRAFGGNGLKVSDVKAWKFIDDI